MPRRSSGGRPAPRAAPVRNPPRPVARASPPAVDQRNGGSMSGGLGAAIADGMAFGTGNAVAHRAVDAMVGPRNFHLETVVSQAAGPAPIGTCDIHSKAFQDCLNSNGSEISKCQFYIDMLNECRRNSGSMIGA